MERIDKNFQTDYFHWLLVACHDAMNFILHHIETATEQLQGKINLIEDRKYLNHNSKKFDVNW